MMEQNMIALRNNTYADRIWRRSLSDSISCWDSDIVYFRGWNTDRGGNTDCVVTNCIFTRLKWHNARQCQITLRKSYSVVCYGTRDVINIVDILHIKLCLYFGNSWSYFDVVLLYSWPIETNDYLTMHSSFTVAVLFIQISRNTSCSCWLMLE